MYICLYVHDRSYVSLYASLTVEGAGHSGSVGTKQLGGISLGAFLLLVSINTLQSKPTADIIELLPVHASLPNKNTPWHCGSV